MPFDFDTPIDRTGTSSVKWRRFRSRDVIPMWVADMDFRSPPSVIEALKRRAGHGVFGYTLPPDDLVQTVIERFRRLYDWTIDTRWIVWLPGVMPGVNALCRIAGDPGSEVLTHTPIYPPFLEAPGNMGQHCVRVPMQRGNGRWEIDTDAMEAAITPRTRTFLLSHPQNPTGRLFTREELTWMVDFCLRHDLLLCSDEIHCDLVLDPERRHIPTATVFPDAASLTVTLTAPSKTYNIAGLGCALAIIPNDTLRAEFKAAIEGIVPHVNLMGYEAALAAYRDGDDWLEALLDYLRENHRIVMKRVATWPGVKTTPVEATYLAWLDCRGLAVEDPARFFEEAGVGVSDGATFASRGFVRLNFGCPRSQLEEALDRMEKAVGKAGAGG